MKGKIITLLLTRHAEASSTTGDPGLSQAGKARAQALVSMLEKAGVTKVYSTWARRARETAQPLASHLNLQNTPYKDVDIFVRNLLSKQDGEVIFAVGHAPTIPEIIEQLGGNLLNPVTANEFDNMYIITSYIPENGDTGHVLTNVVRLKYDNSFNNINENNMSRELAEVIR